MQKVVKSTKVNCYFFESVTECLERRPKTTKYLYTTCHSYKTVIAFLDISVMFYLCMFSTSRVICRVLWKSLLCVCGRVKIVKMPGRTV